CLPLWCGQIAKQPCGGHVQQLPVPFAFLRCCRACPRGLLTGFWCTSLPTWNTVITTNGCVILRDGTQERLKVLHSFTGSVLPNIVARAKPFRKHMTSSCCPDRRRSRLPATS